MINNRLTLTIPKNLKVSAIPEVDIGMICPLELSVIDELLTTLGFSVNKNTPHGIITIKKSIPVLDHRDGYGLCLLYCFKGAGLLTAGDTEYPLQEGYFCIFDDTIPHNFYSISSKSIVYIVNIKNRTHEYLADYINEIAGFKAMRPTHE